jgi:hypothetical protein
MELKPWILATDLPKPGKDPTAKLALETGKRMPVMVGTQAAELPFVITDFWELTTDDGDYFDVLAVPEQGGKHETENIAVLTRIPSEHRVFEQYRVLRTEAEAYFQEIKAEEPEPEPEPEVALPPQAAPAPATPAGWVEGEPHPVGPPPAVTPDTAR